MSASVKRKPVYCGACSMDISNAVRIRCAQLAPPPAATRQDDAGNTILLSSSATKKHDPVDSISTGPRSDGLVPTCEEFDLCGSCFCEGKEIGRHKRWHDYRVVVRLSHFSASLMYRLTLPDIRRNMHTRYSRTIGALMSELNITIITQSHNLMHSCITGSFC